MSKKFSVIILAAATLSLIGYWIFDHQEFRLLDTGISQLEHIISYTFNIEEPAAPQNALALRLAAFFYGEETVGQVIEHRSLQNSFDKRLDAKGVRRGALAVGGKRLSFSIGLRVVLYLTVSLIISILPYILLTSILFLMFGMHHSRPITQMLICSAAAWLLGYVSGCGNFLFGGHGTHESAMMIAKLAILAYFFALLMTSCKSSLVIGWALSAVSGTAVALILGTGCAGCRHMFIGAMIITMLCTAKTAVLVNSMLENQALARFRVMRIRPQATVK